MRMIFVLRSFRGIDGYLSLETKILDWVNYIIFRLFSNKMVLTAFAKEESNEQPRSKPANFIKYTLTHL